MTKIEWTRGDDGSEGKTWNPIIGCTRVSPGCVHCYTERLAWRFAGPGGRYEELVKRVGNEARWTGKVRLVDSVLEAPLHWRKPRRIFVNSMGDLFHEAVPDEWIDRAFAVMAFCPQHTFLVLTKRPERMRDYIDGGAAPVSAKASVLFAPLSGGDGAQAATFSFDSTGGSAAAADARPGYVADLIGHKVTAGTPAEWVDAIADRAESDPALMSRMWETNQAVYARVLAEAPDEAARLRAGVRR